MNSSLAPADGQQGSDTGFWIGFSFLVLCLILCCSF